MTIKNNKKLNVNYIIKHIYCLFNDKRKKLLKKFSQRTLPKNPFGYRVVHHKYYTHKLYQYFLTSVQHR